MYKTDRRTMMKVLGLGGLASSIPCAFGAKHKPNVLFLAVDDLRPQLHCYGQKDMISPNMDKLAAEGILFANSFCNVPVCGASRASLLTGVRPTPTRFLGYDTWKNEHLPDYNSLPMHFKNNGYHTISNGKVYHHNTDDLHAWSEPPWRPKGDWVAQGYLNKENQEIAQADNGKRGPAWENMDVEDNAYPDGKIADKAISDLERLAKMDAPFFLATGFLKPHLPFNAPKKYWDMYDHDKINLADNPFKPKDAPDLSIHQWGELRHYYGIPAKGSLTDEQARMMIHGYYACVSYTDAQIGRVLDALERLGLKDNTIVILWGDHGWNLGEHGLWCKHCNYRTSLKTPMIISAPGVAGGKTTQGLTEFVDIYPTLCALAGVAIPEHLDGKNLVPLMKNPEMKWSEAVYSRYFKGESITTERYCYTEYRDAKRNLLGRMLYDHENDPKENVNISERPENQKLVAELSQRLQQGQISKVKFEPKKQ
jgi:iduronate 2-sulfatase